MENAICLLPANMRKVLFKIWSVDVLKGYLLMLIKLLEMRNFRCAQRAARVIKQN